MQHPPLEPDDTTHVQHTLPPEATRVGERNEGVLTVLRGPNAGSLYTLESSHVILGRSGEAHLLLTDSALSRRHACIARKPDGYYLQDLGSTNGTRVDGRPAEQPVLLHDGARIEMGEQTMLRFGLHDRVEQQAARRTHELMIRDALTGSYNRRHVEHRLQSELAFARRHGTALCALLIDVDHFKHVNDAHGHDAGDLVLRVIARALDRMLRIEDVVGRWGGEEFVVLARGIDENGGRALGERVRRAIEVLRIPIGGSHGNRSVRLTASVGVAHQGGEIDGDSLLLAADEALYAAKQAGRNRVVTAPPPVRRDGRAAGREPRVGGARKASELDRFSTARLPRIDPEDEPDAR